MFPLAFGEGGVSLLKSMRDGKESQQTTKANEMVRVNAMPYLAVTRTRTWETQAVNGPSLPSLPLPLPLPLASSTAHCPYIMHTLSTLSPIFPSFLRLSSLFIALRLPPPLFPALSPTCRQLLPHPARHSGRCSNHQAVHLSPLVLPKVPMAATRTGCSSVQLCGVRHRSGTHARCAAGAVVHPPPRGGGRGKKVRVW